MAIFCFWWDYFDMIRSTSPNPLLRLTKLFNYSSIEPTKGSDPYKGVKGKLKNTDAQTRTNSIISQPFWQDLLLRKKYHQ